MSQEYGEVQVANVHKVFLYLDDVRYQQVLSAEKVIKFHLSSIPVST